ncbi:MAG: hypothetical protein J1E40_02655 [Oscillospiraceae bacterium]|nr:hypothetical protein [Oscillospiraceae bacterium]
MENSKCIICGKDIEAHDIDALIKCGSSALKSKKWSEAESLFDQVIKKDNEEARAYFGKLLAECECTDEHDLMKHPLHIHDKDSYKKAYQFADDAFKRDLDNYNDEISYNVACQMYASKDISSLKNALNTFTSIIDHKDSREMAEKCKEKIYGYAVEHMTAAKTEKDFRTAKSEFEIIKGYSDADARAAECAARSDDSTDKNVIYQEALKLGRSDSMIDLKNAIKKLEEIPDYNDAKQKLEIFRKRYREMTDQSTQGQRQSEIDRQNTIQRMQEEEEKKAARARITKIIVSAVFIVLLVVILIIFYKNTPGSDTGNEMVLYGNANYYGAVISSDRINMDFEELL